MLTQEFELDKHSGQEATESTSRCQSCHQKDLIVIDGDAALVLDEPGDFAEVLCVIESRAR